MGGCCSRRAPTLLPRHGPDVSGEGVEAQPVSPVYSEKHKAYLDRITLQPRPRTWDKDD